METNKLWTYAACLAIGIAMGLVASQCSCSHDTVQAPNQVLLHTSATTASSDTTLLHGVDLFDSTRNAWTRVDTLLITDSIVVRDTVWQGAPTVNIPASPSGLIPAFVANFAKGSVGQIAGGIVRLFTDPVPRNLLELHAGTAAGIGFPNYESVLKGYGGAELRVLLNADRLGLGPFSVYCEAIVLRGVYFLVGIMGKIYGIG